MKKALHNALALLFLPMVTVAQTATTDTLSARDFTNAILWQQSSGEYRALAFQAYNFARISLKASLKDVKRRAKKCVIVDVDETVLDNSSFQGHELHRNISYEPSDWRAWAAKAAADTVPGALGFLKYAQTKRAEVFYVTNRDRTEYAGTLANLQKFGFPNADEQHLLVRDATSDKEPRRQRISETYKILLLCGDNLSDFSNVFYRENKITREEVDSRQAMFGVKFIVLPNPMYGDWEQAIYKPATGLSEKEKADRRLKAVRGY